MSTRSYKPHAAQLKALQILKLAIEVHDPETASSDSYSFSEYAFETGRSDFNKVDSTVHVMIRVRAGKYAVDDSNESEENVKFSSQPISVTAEIGGIFNIDTEIFPEDKIHNWAETNAPLILYPYIREQIYGLSTRVGIKPVLLPLLEVPSFKINVMK